MPFCRNRFQCVQLVRSVYDNMPDAQLHSIPQIRVRLVVAVEEYAFHRKSGGMCGVQFTGRHTVRTHLLLCHHAVQLSEAKRFSGENRECVHTEMCGKCSAIHPALRTNRVQIEIICRCAKGFRQLHRVQRTDGQMTGIVYGKGWMQKHRLLLQIGKTLIQGCFCAKKHRFALFKAKYAMDWAHPQNGGPFDL